MTNDISGRIAEDLKNRLAQEGEHVGTVDHFDGNQLKLTRDDSTDGQHHYVALSQVESMDNVAVYLNVSRNDIK